MSEIIVLNAGGQYCHLIARKVRELGVYAEIKEFNANPAELKNAKGIILSGGPDSVYTPNGPKVSEDLFTKIKVPILGICYSHQLMAQMLGGKVVPGKTKEYGVTKIDIKKEDSIFAGLNRKHTTVWMSHGDSVEKLPKGFQVLSASDNCQVAAMANIEKRLYGLQFHPEVAHTTYGKQMLKNFVFNICQINDKTWDPKRRVDSVLGDIREKAKGRKVFFLVSGGIDSTVAFDLCVRSLGTQNVKGIYIDTGFMRKGETEEIMDDFKKRGIDSSISFVDARNKFIGALKNEFDAESKRKKIGKTFIDIKNEEFSKLKKDHADWMLGQGTIYPDTIESGCSAHASRIKTHHNRVDEILQLINENKVVEPLAEFYKDEVRALAKALGLPDHIVHKEPFPGPGLAVRCICSPSEKPISPDAELTQLLSKYGLKGFVAPIKTVGVQGDFRSYSNIAVIFGNASNKELGKISTEITNNISSINRVAYLVQTTKDAIIDKMRINRAFITKKRLDALKEADYIVRTFVKKHKGQLPDIWQFPVVLFPLGYKNTESIALRPILSTDGMTANFADIERKLLHRLSSKILKLNGISAVLYDITNKPPATIEWE